MILIPALGATDLAAVAVWGSWLFAGALGLAGLVILRGKLRTHVDTPRWEPDKSWLTNVAVVGAVFNGLFAVTALTEKLGSMSAAELVVTTALFVALAGLAPAIFELGAASSPDGGSGGSLGWFLAAAVFTLWAGGGQLALSLALLEEARGAALLAPVVCVLLQVLIVVLVAGVGWYAIWSFVELEKTPADAATRESRPAAGWRLL